MREPTESTGTRNSSTDIKECNVGISIGLEKIANILCFVDDIVLLAENEKDLQLLLSALYEWTTKWRMNNNVNKSKTVHFRFKRIKLTNCKLIVGNENLDIVSDYNILFYILVSFCSIE